MSSRPSFQAVFVFTTHCEIVDCAVCLCPVNPVVYKVVIEKFNDSPEVRMNSQDYRGDRWKRTSSLGYPEDHMVWGLILGH